MPMEMDGRVPPHSDDAEKSLLGAMMLSREAVMMAVETLQSDDFYSAVNKALFEAMCALYAAGRPVDLVTMTDELNRRGMMEGICGQRAGLRPHRGGKKHPAPPHPRLRRGQQRVLYRG